MSLPMEAVMDDLASFIFTNASPTINALLSGGNTISITIGDPGTSAPTGLPAMYLAPLWDSVKPYTAGPHGLDFETYAIPILIVDDLHAYGPPIPNPNVPGTFEQPGYRRLMQYGQITRDALRGSSGTGITLSGNVATSTVPAISYVWVNIDEKPYRGVRVAFSIGTRVQRT